MTQPKGEYGKPWLRPEPPEGMEGRALDLWQEVLASFPDDHWLPSDRSILETYCRATVACHEALVLDEHAAAVKYGNLQLASATKLRLTPLARYRPETISRRAQKAVATNRELEPKGSDENGEPAVRKPTLQ